MFGKKKKINYLIVATDKVAEDLFVYNFVYNEHRRSFKPIGEPTLERYSDNSDVMCRAYYGTLRFGRIDSDIIVKLEAFKKAGYVVDYRFSYF